MNSTWTNCRKIEIDIREFDSEPYDEEMTLVFLVKDNKVKLAKKKTKIGIDCWNGYGGKVRDTDLSIESAATRELEEETRGEKERGRGVIVPIDSLRKCAICFFTILREDGSCVVRKVHVFFSNVWLGEFRESNEMGLPKSFQCDKLPFDEMMEADRIWIPDVLRGKKIVVKATMKVENNRHELVGAVIVTSVGSFK